MTRYRKYKRAFKIACELLGGCNLYGYDTDRIFEEIMKEDGVVCSFSYEEFILKNLKKLSGNKRWKDESTYEVPTIIEEESEDAKE